MGYANTYEGACHCGNIAVTFASDKTASEFVIRTCQCSFCRKHGTRAITDADGHLRVRIRDGKQLNRYVFGLKTAEFLVCRICGVYVAAVTRTGTEPLGIPVVNALSDCAAFSTPPVPSDYDAETRSERQARRQASWTPVTFEAW